MKIKVEVEINFKDDRCYRCHFSETQKCDLFKERLELCEHYKYYTGEKCEKCSQIGSAVLRCKKCLDAEAEVNKNNKQLKMF